MSEEIDKKPILKKIERTGAYAFVHPCSVCGETASFGFNVKLRDNKPGQWFCSTHKPKSKPAEIAPAPKMDERGQKRDTQGDLF